MCHHGESNDLTHMLAAPTTEEEVVYHFGYRQGGGHFLFNASYRHVDPSILPWPDIDGTLCPVGPSGPEGIALLHHKDGWTAIAFWDRSGDSRPASNAAFFVKGDRSFITIMMLAKRHFPKVWARFTFNVVEALHARSQTPGS